jgi:hypothetical protein
MFVRDPAVTKTASIVAKIAPAVILQVKQII